MDPNANWAEARELASKIDGSEDRPDEQDARRLAELVCALDMWISSGGFPPDAFKRE